MEHCYRTACHNASPIHLIQLFCTEQHIAHYANNQLTTLSAQTGEIIQQSRLPHPAYGLTRSDASLLFCQSATASAPASVYACSIAGEIEWTLEMGKRSLLPPIEINGLTLISDGRTLWSISVEGSLTWIANQDGLVAEANTRQQPPEHLPTEIMRAVSSTTVLVFLEANYYLLDTARLSIERLTPKAQVQAAIGANSDLEQIIWRGYATQIYPGGPCQWSVHVTDLSGKVLHERSTREKLERTTSSRTQIYLISTPEQGYWDKYAHWYDLHSKIRCLNQSGELGVLWTSPAPIGSVVIQRDQSVLYAVSGPSLYAIAING